MYRKAGKRRRGGSFKSVISKIGQVGLHALPFVLSALGRKKRRGGRKRYRRGLGAISSNQIPIA
jgi:hypothetical protein